jgi:CheY-like chemotaxis protein
MRSRLDIQPTLLIGDDDSAMRECVVELVSGRGFRILTADCGERSLQILLAEQVDLTILDIHMPDMTGMAVFERYVRGPFIAAPEGPAQHAGARRLDAIFMSADATPEIRTWCESVGSRLLNKPFEPDAMRAAIDAVLGGRSGL